MEYAVEYAHDILRFSLSLLPSSCTNIVLHGCFCRSLWRILLGLLMERSRVAVCFRTKCHGDCWFETFTASIFSRIQAICGRLVDFHFNALKLVTYNEIMFRVVTESCLPNWKCTRNALCVAVTDLFFINVSAVKSRSWPVQSIPVTWNEIKQNGILCTLGKYKHFFHYLF